MRNQFMGVGKSMKIFMEGMQNSMMSSGYTGKIVNTPMGPFAWNEATNSWVNQNNGFSIPNISLQDLMMYDYGSVSDETAASNKSTQCLYAIETLANRDIGTISVRSSFGNTSIRNNTCPFNLSLSSTSTGRNQFDIFVSTDFGASFIQFTYLTGALTRTDPITISTTQMRIYIQPHSPSAPGSTIEFDLINDSDNNTVLATYAASLAP